MYESFLQTVREYYAAHGRHDLPWRVPEADGSFDPYRILVSELMLQQTQVPRVMPKFREFILRYPTFHALADAPLGDVLIAWQGLGYNRRAKFLWQASRIIVGEHGGVLPRDQVALEKLPGIGHNTAGAILAYAYNLPTVFIETNIRTVYIHHFFKDRLGVGDAEILPLVEATLDQANPREFYWQLMDYGTFLKQTVGNLSRASKSYAKQSRFHGSLRQLRGKALRQLVHGWQSREVLLQALADERAEDVLAALLNEGMIEQTNGGYRLP